MKLKYKSKKSWGGGIHQVANPNLRWTAESDPTNPSFWRLCENGKVKIIGITENEARSHADRLNKSLNKKK